MKSNPDFKRRDPTLSSLNVSALSPEVRRILENPFIKNSRYLKRRSHSGGTMPYLDIPKEGRFYMVDSLRQQFIGMLIGAAIKRAELFTVQMRRGSMTYSKEIPLKDITNPVSKSEILAEGIAFVLLFETGDHSLAWRKSDEPYEFSNILAREVGEDSYQHYLFDFGLGNVQFSKPYALHVLLHIGRMEVGTRAAILDMAKQKIIALQTIFEGKSGEHHFKAIVERMRSIVIDRRVSAIMPRPENKGVTRAVLIQRARQETFTELPRELGTYWGDIATEIGAKRGATKYYKDWMHHLHTMARVAEDLRKLYEKNPSFTFKHNVAAQRWLDTSYARNKPKL